VEEQERRKILSRGGGDEGGGEIEDQGASRAREEVVPLERKNLGGRKRILVCSRPTSES